MKRISLIVVFAGLLAGCGEPTIDGSSQEAFEESIKAMTEGLTSEEERQLGRDITQISSLKEMNMAHVVSAAHREELQGKVRSELDGKSREEISKLASVSRMQERIAERDSLLEELRSAEEKVEALENEQAKISLIQVSSVKSNTVDIGLGDQEHTVSFTLKNGTTDTIIRVGIYALVTKTNNGSEVERSMPVDLPVPLGPDESTQVEHEVNPFGLGTILTNISPDNRELRLKVKSYIKSDRSGVGQDSLERARLKVSRLKEKLESDFNDL